LVEAAGYLELAVANASRRSDIEQFAFELERVKRDMLAAAPPAAAVTQGI